MKKTFQVHFRIEYAIIESLREEAKREGLSLAELCRQRILGNRQLNRIEILITNLAHSIKNKGGDK